MEIPSLILGLVGTVTGTAASAITWANYWRDRAVVKVHLKWDMAVTDNPIYDRTKLWGLVSVTNVGRRPLYLGNVALEVPRIELPKGHALLVHGRPPTYLILPNSLKGTSANSRKLSEGDPPLLFIVDQEGLKPYAAHWHKIRAYAEDSTGRKFWSSKAVKEQPEWAKLSPRPNN